MDKPLTICLGCAVLCLSLVTVIGELDPDKYLVRFGYLPPMDPKTGQVWDAASRQTAIRNFQQMMNLPVTGRMDRRTRDVMRRPRCGLPDVDITGKEANFPNRPAAYYAPGFKWSKKDLTWHLNNYTPDLPYGSQRRIMYNALKKWSDVSTLKFRESGGSADIDIKFVRGNHGDGAGNSFDGPGGVLAHAFYPENGDTHFDEDESWTENSPKGTNLEIVAAHEFGHALGLSHSNVEGALMAPYYQGYTPGWKLHDDDIRGIQSLYGPNTKPSTRPPTTTTTTSPPRPTPRPTVPPTGPKGAPNKCKTKFDDIIFNRDNKYYAFRREYVFQIDPYYGVTPGYPRMIRDLWPRAPKNTGGAVYSWRTRYTYFFKGRKIWKYDGYKLVTGYPKYMRDPNYPTKPQAALAWRDGRIYLFMGDKYYEFDEARVSLRPGYPKPVSSNWQGIPKNIEGAVWSRYDSKTYFFKGKNYRKFSDYYRRTEAGYPKATAPAWMGCGPKVPK